MLLTKIHTYLQLGLTNILRVAAYRIGIRIGLHPATRIKRKIGGERFFRNIGNYISTLPSSGAWKDEAVYFGWYRVPLGNDPPDWHANPFSGKRVEPTDLQWWKLPDFGLDAGDIKCVWEASRFDWVVADAQRGATGDNTSLEKLNRWLSDWCRKNPAYYGPNWKCGQEASIRVMHLVVAAMILQQEENPNPELVQLVDAHLVRIRSTLSYAKAQDNNHGTSEAAALFIGGSFLAKQGVAGASLWAKKGRICLEKRVSRLVAPDGSFSQYSVNYHRLMLDTLCFAEVWRRKSNCEPFSKVFYERASAASWWLYSMVAPESGDAPNLGANDGARILQMSDTDYRDFRPSVQAAMAVFCEKRAYGRDGEYNRHAGWLGVDLPTEKARQPGCRQFDHGGYAILRAGCWNAVLRLPRFRFRPGHCDALHLDLWHGPDNLLRDAGSFSYNTDEKWLNYFPGTVAHNTVSFDDRDQMPKVGKFLRGKWLVSRGVEPVKEDKYGAFAAAGYCDWKGAFHHRKVCLAGGLLTVQDKVDGFAKKAVLRWRLAPGEWQLEGSIIYDRNYILKVFADVPIERIEIVDGWESRYYMKKTVLPVLEIEISRGGHLTTEFKAALI